MPHNQHLPFARAPRVTECPSRRDFVASVLPLSASLLLSSHRGAGTLSAQTRNAVTTGPLFEGYVIPPRPGVQEVTLARLNDDRYWMLFGEKNRLVGKYSSDFGRTWSDTTLLRSVDGSEIATGRDNAHLTLLHLRSGNLGMVYGGPYSRPGRDGTVLFRSSKDGGKTWSAPVVVDPIFSVCRTQGARVLSTGRIVVPVFNWYLEFLHFDFTRQKRFPVLSGDMIKKKSVCIFYIDRPT